MNDMSTLGFAIVLIGALAAQSTLLLRITGRQIAASEKYLDARLDALTQVMDARFGSVDHRLEALESDVRLIKQHLLSTTAA